MADGPPNAGWSDVLAELDEKHQKAHDRLRLDLRELESRVENNYQHFDTVTGLHRAKIGTLEATTGQPIDATKLVLSTKEIVALLAAVLAIVASYWNLTNKVDAQQRMAEDLVKTTTAAAKLQEMQMQQLSATVTEAKSAAADGKRQYELLRYEFQSLKETVIGKGKH